ncbi:putative cytosine-specific methyltransferase [Podospora australis]|uniref:Cytosine-specific methyltransferase n=1 Tax=Podospora australis TaxID=1536484 RepID=A0AAN6X1I6_9PEZI|nr:putative cytosine-specific methyltransferase [Podospora australis]
MLGARTTALRGGEKIWQHIRRTPRLFLYRNTTTAAASSQPFTPKSADTSPNISATSENGGIDSYEGFPEATVSQASDSEPNAPKSDDEPPGQWLWNRLNFHERDQQRLIDEHGDAISDGWGRRRVRGRKSHRYPSFSPAKALAILSRRPRHEWTKSEKALAVLVATNATYRPAILAAQLLLRREAILAHLEGNKIGIEAFLHNSAVWRARITILKKSKGYTRGDLLTWLWILSPEASDDVKVQRFLSSNCQKPRFLLHLLLAPERALHEPETIMKLVDYVSDMYIPQNGEEVSHAVRSQRTWLHFLQVLHCLVRHARQSWPAAMEAISHLTVNYLVAMSAELGRRKFHHQARCFVFNKAMRYFGWSSAIQPIANRIFNWAAQRNLLGIAGAFDPPLVLTRSSYQSVRSVLAGLAKNTTEAKNASRLRETWPPHRETVDGIDERRDLEDDLSRSVKALLLAREAGYSDTPADRAITVLGGSTFGQLPTIATRSTPLPNRSGSDTSSNWYNEWASRVRATRNAREAWMQFERPPIVGMKPDARVYAEMFEKLFAREVAQGAAKRLPGDVKEVFPVQNGNLTSFEIERLTPPTPNRLYDDMILEGIRPTGRCLELLLRNAHSKKIARQIIKDSVYGDELSHPASNPARFKLKFENSVGSSIIPGEVLSSMNVLSSINPGVFNAWIALLSRITSPLGSNLVDAISLAHQYQMVNLGSPRARNDKIAWHSILKALAWGKTIYSARQRRESKVLTLFIFLKLYERIVDLMGHDAVLLEYLSVMTWRTFHWATWDTRGFRSYSKREEEPKDFEVLQKLLGRAHKLAVRSFHSLAFPMLDVDSEANKHGLFDQTLVRANMVGEPIYHLMAAMAMSRDPAQMVGIMDWALDGLGDAKYLPDESKRSDTPAFWHMMNAFSCFFKLGKGVVPAAELNRIKHRLNHISEHRWTECAWFYPAPDKYQRDEEFVKGGLAILDRFRKPCAQLDVQDLRGDPELAHLEADIPVKLLYALAPVDKRYWSYPVPRLLRYGEFISKSIPEAMVDPLAQQQEEGDLLAQASNKSTDAFAKLESIKQQEGSGVSRDPFAELALLRPQNEDESLHQVEVDFPTTKELYQTALDENTLAEEISRKGENVPADPFAELASLHQQEENMSLNHTEADFPTTEELYQTTLDENTPRRGISRKLK